MLYCFYITFHIWYTIYMSHAKFLCQQDRKTLEIFFCQVRLNPKSYLWNVFLIWIKICANKEITIKKTKSFISPIIYCVLTKNMKNIYILSAQDAIPLIISVKQNKLGIIYLSLIFNFISDNSNDYKTKTVIWKRRTYYIIIIL